jgi:REP element-mobilizing transposase RayT
MEKFKGKYRTPSARWSAWNYGDNAAYFVTICTKTRSHDFGEIADGEMQLNPLGQSAWDCWSAIPDHFPFVILGVFVVMPNHVHGIIIIAKSEPLTAVETQNFASLQSPQPQQSQNKFGPQSQNLASIVRGYKIGVTKFSKEQNIPFTWQPRYHDRVIRNEAEYGRIEQYIHNNPRNWKDDSLYTSP